MAWLKNNIDDKNDSYAKNLDNFSVIFQMIANDITGELKRVKLDANLFEWTTPQTTSATAPLTDPRLPSLCFKYMDFMDILMQIAFL